ncbi:MAG: DUF4331 domain-containing protein [Actinomycetota bacterium]|nr:DUF4331 domain-containing protein [Actinomycetota bacterium]
MRKLSLAAAGAALVAAAIAVPLSTGSSHREAPNTMQDPAADNTDVYAFVPKDDPTSVALIANWIPGENPANGPLFQRFDDAADYYINIDNTGDGVPDIRYLFRFHTELRSPDSNLYSLPGVTSLEDPKLNLIQTYDLFRERLRDGERTSIDRIANDVFVAPANIGPKTFPDYPALTREAIDPLRGGGFAFAGQRDDAFFIDLGATFDALNIRRGTGNEGAGKDDFSGMSTFTTTLRIPMQRITRDREEVDGPDDPQAVIGVWSSSERRKIEVTNSDFDDNRLSRGSKVQVSRLGVPLVNELIIPIGMKDRFNRTTPDEDAENYGQFVVKPELAAVLNALFDVGAPEEDRTDLVQALLQGIPDLNQLDDGDNPLPTDTLKLNMGVPITQTPNRFGVLGGDLQGFPNGRRLGDDVVDIALQVVAGFLMGNEVPLGDGVDVNDKPFSDAFPYQAAPTSGLDNNPANRFEPVHPPVPAGGG